MRDRGHATDDLGGEKAYRLQQGVGETGCQEAAGRHRQQVADTGQTKQSVSRTATSREIWLHRLFDEVYLLLIILIASKQYR
jgi:hypothetical protein